MDKMIETNPIDLAFLMTLLKSEYDNLEITNVNARGSVDKRVVYIYEKGKERRSNVFLEIWHMKRTNSLEFVIWKDLLTPSEVVEVDRYDQQSNGKRGTLCRDNWSQEELIQFVRNKINIYCNQRGII